MCASPHLAEYFMVDGANRLNALAAEDRERVRGEVRDYLGSYPELAATFTAG